MEQQDELKKLTSEQETYLVMSRKVTEVHVNRLLELCQEENKTQINKKKIIALNHFIIWQKENQDGVTGIFCASIHFSV